MLKLFLTTWQNLLILSFCASEARKNLGEHDLKDKAFLSSGASPDPSSLTLQQDDKGSGREFNSLIVIGRCPTVPVRFGLLCLQICCLFIHTALAQDLVILPYNAPTVAVVTSLDTEKALSELSTSFVQEGYVLDFGSMNEQQFSTQPREVHIADDLEFKAFVKHTVVLQDAQPLATVHIKTTWNYGDLSTPVDANPQALIKYKERYVPVYSNRIRLYIDALVSKFEYTLLAHPLHTKP